MLLIADFDTFGGTRKYFNQLTEFYKTRENTIFYAIEPRTAKKTSFSPDHTALFFLPELVLNQPSGFIQAIIGLIKFSWIQLKTYIVIRNEIKTRKIDFVVISTGYGDRYLSILAINKPCIYITHSIPQKSSNDVFFRFFLKKTLNSQKRIIAVSENMKEMINKYWGTEETKKYVITIYNSSKSIEQPLSYNDTLPSRKTILTLGHVIWYKNPEMWIQVVEHFNTHSQLKNYNWLWAGDGELLKNCQTMIKNKNLLNASFIGYCSNVQNLYDQAIIYFQPSILESFGLSVLDAMQRGIPCVVTRVGGLPELVIDGETGFTIEEGDITGAVEKISWLLSHPEESDRMGKAGYLRYKELFTEEKWFENMQKVHSEILSYK